jgi:hypothetical protein
VVIVAAMVISGHFLGPFGVVLAGAVTVSTIMLFIATDVLPTGFQRATCVAACLVLVTVVVSHSLGVFDAGPPTSEPPITRATGTQLGGADFDLTPLSDAQLDGLVAPGASFTNARLEHADLTGANLRGASIVGAHLHGAHLRDADLAGADLTNADLTGADLTDACLLGATLTGARLDDVNATGAAVGGAVVAPAQTTLATTWPSSTTVNAACHR